MNSTPLLAVVYHVQPIYRAVCSCCQSYSAARCIALGGAMMLALNCISQQVPLWEVTFLTVNDGQQPTDLRVGALKMADHSSYVRDEGWQVVKERLMPRGRKPMPLGCYGWGQGLRYPKPGRCEEVPATAKSWCWRRAFFCHAVPGQRWMEVTWIAELTGTWEFRVKPTTCVLQNRHFSPSTVSVGG